MDEIIDYKLMTSLGVGDDATNTDLLIAALTGPELTSAWTEALANWTDSTPARRGDVRDHVVGLRDHLLHVLADIDNEPEREAVATLFYIGLKSHWMVVNTQFAYQLRSGDFDDTLLYRSSLLSSLLGAMETVLKPARAARIGEFLAEPLTLENQTPVASDNKPSDPVFVLPDQLLAAAAASTPESRGLCHVIAYAQSLETRIVEITAQMESLKQERETLLEPYAPTERGPTVTPPPVIAPRPTKPRSVLDRLTGPP